MNKHRTELAADTLIVFNSLPDWSQPSLGSHFIQFLFLAENSERMGGGGGGGEEGENKHDTGGGGDWEGAASGFSADQQTSGKVRINQCFLQI